MARKLTIEETIRFDEPGTLVRPGPVGRLVRLALGAICLWLVWQLVTRSGLPDLYNPSFWLITVLALSLVPYVINIGYGVNWGAWPRNASIALLAGAALFGYLDAGSPMSTPLWATATIWMVYLYAHLGISFVLAAALATPGCEMRAMPDLFGLVTRRAVREHHCPSFIDNVDRWEYRRHAGDADATYDGSQADARGGKDLLGSTLAQLVVYGVPFVAVQVAGNLGGFAPATALAAIAFLSVGVVCSYNAYRSSRVHCFFVGPWCLLAALLIGLYGFGLVDFGPDSWSLLVNSGLAGAAVLYVASEKIWGRYFGRD